MSDTDLLNIQPDPEPAPKPATQPALDVTTARVTVNTLNPLVTAVAAQGIAPTPEQVKILDSFMVKAAQGHQSALPMKCQGTKCPLLDICPLHNAKMALPVGKACPVEESVMAQWVAIHMDALDIDPADPGNAVDVNMVFELAGLEMLRYRAAWHLSVDPTLVETRIVGYSPQGEPIYDERPRMALLILEKYAKVIGKIREQLLATRRAQAQVGRINSDVSVRGANMLKQAREIAERRRQGGKIEDANFTVKDDNAKPSNKPAE